MSKATKTKKAVSLEVFIFLAVIIAFFGLIGAKMGGVNMMQTMMNTAYQLLLETVFYIMAIAVIAGAVSGLFSEFGLIALINKIISPLMKPVYDLPGAASMGVLTTYLSDNPAILGLAEDTNFKKYFKKYQLPALTNLGTAFGMGLIVTTSMIGITSPTGENLGFAALIGNIGAIIGSVVSVRMMIWFTKKEYGTTEYCIPLEEGSEKDVFEQREIRHIISLLANHIAGTMPAIMAQIERLITFRSRSQLLLRTTISYIVTTRKRNIPLEILLRSLCCQRHRQCKRCQ